MSPDNRRAGRVISHSLVGKIPIGTDGVLGGCSRDICQCVSMCPKLEILAKLDIGWPKSAYHWCDYRLSSWVHALVSCTHIIDL
jgi:hypothetical protein